MVDYTFYTETYLGGAISAEEWPELEARAADQLRHYKRIYTVTCPEKMRRAWLSVLCLRRYTTSIWS